MTRTGTIAVMEGIVGRTRCHADVSARSARTEATRWHNWGMGEDARQYWFSDGVKAYRLRLEADERSEKISEIDEGFPDGEAYACPCCLGLFGREALQGSDPILTKEGRVQPVVAFDLAGSVGQDSRRAQHVDLGRS